MNAYYIVDTSRISDFSRDAPERWMDSIVGPKLERKLLPYASPRNRYEATRTGLSSPGNEVARLPKGDIGEENGILRGRRGEGGGEGKGRRWRFDRGLNLFVGSGGSLLMPWLVLRFPLCHPTRTTGSSTPPDHIPGRFHPPRARSNHVVHPSARGHHGNTPPPPPPVLCNLSPVHTPYLSGPRAVIAGNRGEGKDSQDRFFF